MVIKQEKSDAALAHKLRDAVAAANDYANRLRERGYKVKFCEFLNDDGDSEIAVVNVETVRTVIL